MPSLWSNEDPNANLGYLNIKRAEHQSERRIRDALEEMWSAFEPFADPDFVPAFAHDPDGHFWELFLGYLLLCDRRTLLTAAERGRPGQGLPDICVVDGDRKIWVEAIAPDDGVEGPNQVVRPTPINEGGRAVHAPERQIQLRTTGALYTKAQVFERYRERGVVGENDVQIIAIGAGRFGPYASDDPPSALRSVFPIGDRIVRMNRQTGDVTFDGWETSWEIERANGPIERTAFIGDDYRHISAIIWSRASIGNFDTRFRPVSMIHNPMSHVGMPQGWSAWDREYVAERVDNGWQVSNTRSDGASVTEG